MIFRGKITVMASGNRGFTLLELIIMISIIGVTAPIMALTFSEVTRVTSSDMSQAIVLSQVHQAGAWISKDVASAYKVTAGSTGTWTCNMTSYLYNSQTGTFANSYENYTISNGMLLRNGNPIAQYIVNPGSDTLFTQVTPTATENHTYVLKIKAVRNTASFSQTFKIYQRMPPQ
jgi:prepilin-type N-terminal cleavage/methylation domain-containing protein